MMAQTSITNDNVTPLIQIITWFILITSISGVFARTVTKFAVLHSAATSDDYFIWISLVGVRISASDFSNSVSLS